MDRVTVRRTDSFSARLHRLIHTDYFPDFTRKVRPVVTGPLGGLLLAAGASLLCGYGLHPRGYILAAGILAILAIGIGWPWLGLRGLSGVLTFDRRRCREGDAIQVTARLRNRLFWGAWGVAVRDGSTTEAVAGLPIVPGRASIERSWSMVPSVRGLYPLSEPRLTSGFPFGLWEAAKPLDVSTPLIVWPRTFPAPPLPETAGEERLEGSVARGKAGSSGEVVGVRPYRRGDSPRRVHWAQTARHDRLVVCELQSNARPLVEIVVDADPSGHAGQGATSSLEWAVRIAASLCESWLQEGAEIGGVFAGRVVPPAGGSGQRTVLLDALARMTDKGPNLRDWLDSAVGRDRFDGLRVIVTTDRAIASLTRNRSAWTTTRFIVLRAAAFTNATAELGSLPIRPWILIDDAERVEFQFRHPLKGGRADD